MVHETKTHLVVTALVIYNMVGELKTSVKSTKSHGISPTASRWNRSHSKIDVGIGPKFFFAEGGLSPTFWDLFHHEF